MPAELDGTVLREGRKVWTCDMADDAHAIGCPRTIKAATWHVKYLGESHAYESGRRVSMPCAREHGYWRSTWTELVTEAGLLGYDVLLVEFVECADTPGLLGMGLGSIHYGTRRIRVREGLPEAERIRVLAHELDHAYRPDAGAEIDAHHGTPRYSFQP